MKLYRWDITARREALYAWFTEYVDLDPGQFGRWWTLSMYRHLRKNGLGPIVARGAIWSMVAKDDLKPKPIRFGMDAVEVAS